MARSVQTATPDSAAIAEGLRRGDFETLGTLICRHQQGLLAYLVSLTRSLPLAEDLSQEAWLHVLERGRQYDGRRPFKPWLFAIGRHLFLDYLRRRAIHSPTAPRSADDDLEAPEELAAADPSPLEAAIRAEHGRQLAQAFETLPTSYREVLALRFTEELSLEDIAVVTASPLPTAKSRLYRGVELLRRRVQEILR